MQPDMRQSFSDHSDLPEGKTSNTPAIPGTVMSQGETQNQVNIETQATYRAGVSKLLHMMQWTRSEIMNTVREVSQFEGRALQLHVRAMYRVMK